MGMILGLYSLEDTTIETVLAHPRLIWHVIAPEDADEIISSSHNAKQGLLARLFGWHKNKPKKLDNLESIPSAATEITDLDKAWHGIHFLLTGSSHEGDPPLNFLLAGGVEVGDIEVGYGTARVFSSSEVAGIDSALRAVSESDFQSRYDPAILKKSDIYPDIWEGDENDDDVLGYLVEYFSDLKQFIRKATTQGLGIVVTIE